MPTSLVLVFSGSIKYVSAIRHLYFFEGKSDIGDILNDNTVLLL